MTKNKPCPQCKTIMELRNTTLHFEREGFYADVENVAAYICPQCGTRSIPGTTAVTQTFSNNTVLNIKGVVYFPSQIVEFDNNGSTTPGGCTQVIGRKINVQNNVNLDNDCAGTGVQPLGTGTSYLVE